MPRVFTLTQTFLPGTIMLEGGEGPLPLLYPQYFSMNVDNLRPDSHEKLPSFLASVSPIQKGLDFVFIHAVI